MHIPGYLDGFRPPLVDATGWQHDDLFWPAYLLQIGLARTAPAAFGADLADLDAYLDRFDRPEAWPVFAIPVAGGTLHLIGCNLPGDRGISWVLDDVARTALDRFAEENGGHPSGPGLPWPLLPPEPAALLMALPAFGDSEHPVEERSGVSAALRAVGATRLVRKLADELLKNRACVLR